MRETEPANVSPIIPPTGTGSNCPPAVRKPAETIYWNVFFSCTGKWSEDSTFASVAGTFHSAGFFSLQPLDATFLGLLEARNLRRTRTRIS